MTDTIIKGFSIHATVAAGWRVTQINPDRLLLAHPSFPPRIVEMRSIQAGDVLPRATDEALGFPPTVAGS